MRWPLLALLVVGCSSDESSFGGERLADGYIRYVASPVDVPPGETVQYVHWVSAPIDRDLDIIDVRGSQGPGGHHAILYASPDVEEAGTVRKWQAGDQINSRFLGGVGGEGVSGTQLPEGAVLRVPAGSAFYIQSHFVNASDQAIEGTSTIEVKLVEHSPDATVLSMFVLSTLAIDVPPGPVEKTLTCAIQQDTPMIMYVNHIHERGVAISTQLQATDGSIDMVKDDPTWSSEWATHPNFAVAPLDQPMLLPAGATLSTRCAWDNLTDQTFKFPDEMCGFLGFFIGERDRACAGGRWIEL